MEWSEVFTINQRARLLSVVITALENFLAWANKNRFGDEVEIAGFYGAGDKLVVRDGKLFEKWHSYDDETFGQFFLRPVNASEWPSLIQRYKIGKKRIDESRGIIEEKILRRLERNNQETEALRELGKLIASPVIRDLLAEIELARVFSGDRLMLTKNGLREVVNSDGQFIRLADKDFPAAIVKYNLRANDLSGWRSRIEKI